MSGVTRSAVLLAGGLLGWAAERAMMRRVETYGTKAILVTDAESTSPLELRFPDDLRDRTMPTEDGGIVHWLECGSPEGESLGGGSPLVLLHGITLEAEAWANQFELSDVARVIALDLRGHGRSTTGSEGATIATNAGDLGALLMHEDLTGAVLVGHSMGGMVLAHFLATASPDVIQRVRAVVFLDSAVRSPVRRLPGQARLEAVAQRSALAAALGTVPDSDAGKLAVMATFGRKPSPADLQAVASSFDRLAPDIYWQSMPSIVDHDVRAALAERTDLGRLDVSVIVGERDRLTPLRSARELVAAFPGARLDVVSDAGHQVMMEAPEFLNERLRSIITGT